MKGEVISVLSFDRRYHILSRVSARNEGQNRYRNESDKTDITESRMR